MWGTLREDSGLSQGNQVEKISEGSQYASWDLRKGYGRVTVTAGETRGLVAKV